MFDDNIVVKDYFEDKTMPPAEETKVVDPPSTADSSDDDEGDDLKRIQAEAVVPLQPCIDNGVWYYVGGDGYTFEASTCDLADFDTQISVFRGNTCDELKCVDGNDQVCGYHSRVGTCWRSTWRRNGGRSVTVGCDYLMEEAVLARFDSFCSVMEILEADLCQVGSSLALQ